jgi:hypothetical protein
MFEIKAIDAYEEKSKIKAGVYKAKDNTGYLLLFKGRGEGNNISYYRAISIYNDGSGRCGYGCLDFNDAIIELNRKKIAPYKLDNYTYLGSSFIFNFEV